MKKGIRLFSVLLSVICAMTLTIGKVHAASEYNYLALGDSITFHGKCDFWWQGCGMAASTPDKDYFHLVTAYLKQTYGDTYSRVYNGDWGVSDQLYKAYYKELTKILKAKTYNLITIQYGANVRTDVGAMENYSTLVETCQKYAPKARIIIVGNFWGYNDVMNKIDNIKLAVAQKYACGYANLTEIRDNSNYQRGLGSIVYDDKGQAHAVDNVGVAWHPNDDGMAYIAQKIEEQIDPQAVIDTNLVKTAPASQEETTDDNQQTEQTTNENKQTEQSTDENKQAEQTTDENTQTAISQSTETAVSSNEASTSGQSVASVNPILTVSAMDLSVNKSAVLKCSNATGTVSWQVNNKCVSLSKKTGTSIKVTGKTAGSATITATMNGLTAECQVFVSKRSLRDGWYKAGKKKYYYADHVSLKNVQMIGKKLYVFNKKGVYQKKKTKELRKVLKKNTPADQVKKILKKNNATCLQINKKKQKQKWNYGDFKLAFKLKKKKWVFVKTNKSVYKDGMHKIGKNQYYYVNNKKLRGIHVIKSKFYVFDNNGKYLKAKSNKLRKASVLNADMYKLKSLLKKYGATYKYTTDLGYSCFGDGTDQIVYYVGFQVSALKHTNGAFTVENIAAEK